jgi:hypothetical protein
MAMSETEMVRMEHPERQHTNELRCARGLCIYDFLLR